MSVQTDRLVSAEEAHEYQVNEGQVNGDINDLARTVIVQAEQIAAVLRAIEQIEAAADERLGWIAKPGVAEGDANRWEAVANAQTRAALKIRRALGADL
jgi:hypothetical protein